MHRPLGGDPVTTVATTDEPAVVPPARPYGRGRLLAGLVARSWLWFVVGCLLVTLVPILFGWRPYVVQTGSMAPRLNVGDVVLVSPTSDRNQLLGRVAAFDSSDHGGEVVIHRVVRFDGAKLVTKGDANVTVDSERIAMSSVRGIGRLLVRWVGLPLIWLRTGRWLFLLLFLASLWLAGLAVVRDHEDVDEEQAGADGGDGADGEAGGAAPTSGPGDGGGAGRPAFGVSYRLAATRRLGGAVLVRRAVLVVVGALVLLVPSAFAAFAATTASTNDSWSVPNWDYTTEINALTPYLYWKLDETGAAATAADSSGNGRTGTYNQNGSATYFTRLVGGGAFTTDSPNNAVAQVNANSCINTTSTTAINAQNPITEIIWFKTTAGYTAGGKLIGFENPRTGVGVAGAGGTYDRMLYMDGNGKVWFGVYNAASFVISSAAALNDGAWHMAAATLGPAGMHLYIDGVQVATNANTVGEATTGFWRVGCGNLSGWAAGWTGPNPPPASTTASNYPFLGSLDEATVFTQQLTAAQITFLYWIR
jgi:signal peptidase I